MLTSWWYEWVSEVLSCDLTCFMAFKLNSKWLPDKRICLLVLILTSHIHHLHPGNRNNTRGRCLKSELDSNKEIPGGEKAALNIWKAKTLVDMVEPATVTVSCLTCKWRHSAACWQRFPELYWPRTCTCNRHTWTQKEHTLYLDFGELKTNDI